ncbi:hypothetical protein MUK42_26807 [Musa troglodytarum]|uniref:Uncharacterized protein n=1 Tax=Musa troglodytarum TaxID=320322 RepID=A0A9E7FIY4_9LILI|nr:hypothetical protein MUK42_26807 [Musa troglodytarum]
MIEEKVGPPGPAGDEKKLEKRDGRSRIPSTALGSSRRNPRSGNRKPRTLMRITPQGMLVSDG